MDEDGTGFAISLSKGLVRINGLLFYFKLFTNFFRQKKVMLT